MITGPVTESSVVISYDDDWTFRPDKDPVILSFSGIKTCDFISLHDSMTSVINIVELKSSAPNISNDQDLDEYLQEQFEKMINSLLILISDINARRRLKITSQHIRKSWILRYGIRFILLIPNFNARWCADLQDALQKKLAHVLKSYANAEAHVVNLELAHRAGWFNNTNLNIAMPGTATP